MADELMPRDAKVVIAILRSMGVERFEPRVLHQLLEFMHRYCADIFRDGADFAEHRGCHGAIESEDVLLAMRLKAAASQTAAPELIHWVAYTRNMQKLPEQTHAGIKLPKAQLCLLNPNYQLEPSDLALNRFYEEASLAHKPGVSTIPLPQRRSGKPANPHGVRIVLGAKRDAMEDDEDVWES